MTTSKLPTSAYIHVPFCRSKCHYCNFISFAGRETCIQEYFNALEREISAAVDVTEFRTIYVGGGTPSVVPFKLYEKILANFKLADSAEITIEVNPGTVSLNCLQGLRGIGFNRLSIGVQSFNDNMLKRLNRPHSYNDALNTIKFSREAGFANISIDLIYGLPAQTISDWEFTLEQAIKLDINHISTYGLKIEEDTEFHRNMPDNLPDEDVTSQMYLKTSEILKKGGFTQYEISNYARDGLESQHNLVYWNNKEYFGFGLASHGHINRIRYSNKIKLEDYLINPLQKLEENKLTDEEILEEAIFLGLRLCKGLNTREFQEIYSVDLTEKFGDVIKKHTQQGLMQLDGQTLKLTPQGILLSNSVLTDFLIK